MCPEAKLKDMLRLPRRRRGITYPDSYRDEIAKDLGKKLKLLRSEIIRQQEVVLAKWRTSTVVVFSYSISDIF